MKIEQLFGTVVRYLFRSKGGMIMLTLILDVLLAVLAVYMLMKGHYGVTRQAGFAPLAVAVLDAAFAGAIDPSLTPRLSAALAVLQVVVLAGAGLLSYQDAVRARNKRARRARRQEVARSRAAFERALEQRQNRGVARRVCA